MLANLKNTCFVKNVQKKQHKHVKNKRAFRDEQTYPGRWSDLSVGCLANL